MLDAFILWPDDIVATFELAIIEIVMFDMESLAKRLCQ